MKEFEVVYILCKRCKRNKFTIYWKKTSLVRPDSWIKKTKDQPLDQLVLVDIFSIKTLRAKDKTDEKQQAVVLGVNWCKKTNKIIIIQGIFIDREHADD